MSTRFAALLVGMLVCILALTMFGISPDIAYQGYHIDSGNKCTVYVYVAGPLALEDRAECGGALVVLTR